MGDCAKRLMINKGMARCRLIVSSCTDAGRRFLSENCRACGAEETSETPDNEQERIHASPQSNAELLHDRRQMSSAFW
jgi:hypothetical protein